MYREIALECDKQAAETKDKRFELSSPEASTTLAGSGAAPADADRLKRRTIGPCRTINSPKAGREQDSRTGAQRQP